MHPETINSSTILMDTQEVLDNLFGASPLVSGNDGGGPNFPNSFDEVEAEDELLDDVSDLGDDLGAFDLNGACDEDEGEYYENDGGADFEDNVVEDSVFENVDEDEGEDEDYEPSDDEDEHSTGENDDEGPTPGMIFPDIESLHSLYQEHAKIKGFSVSIRSVRKDDHGDDKYVCIACHKARVSRAKKRSKRTDCPAKVNAKRVADGTWKVSKVNPNHNHELVPDMSSLMPAHRHIPVHLRRQLVANDIAGLRTSRNIRLAEVQSGGPRNLGCLPRDCRNYIDSQRRLRLGPGDAQAVSNLFCRLQKQDREFAYYIDLDENNRLQNVLWIHPRSRAAYEDFNDVVTFDTTYLVNEYNMPFATVVGINHHGQSILLGCALLRSEDVETYKWLFSHWLYAMNNVQPKCIMTDQAETIKAAIDEVMPDAQHRLCLWHIMTKLPKKFHVPKRRGLMHRRCAAFKKLIYETISPVGFEAKWAAFLETFCLQENDWLKSLFEVREKWVPCYSMHMFWAGIKSTQRSESMHAFFDGYVGRDTSLSRFVEQYELAMFYKIQNEWIADFRSKNIVMVSRTDFPWELQFRDAYTNDMYAIVQEEIDRMVYSNVRCEQVHQSSGIVIFSVQERSLRMGEYGRNEDFTVEYNPEGEHLSCTCRNFEFRGFLCCHIFSVLSWKDIRHVHERYILRRWRKDVYRRHSSIFFMGSYPHMTQDYKDHQKQESLFLKCSDAGVGNYEVKDLVTKRLEELWDEVEELRRSQIERGVNVSQRPSTNLDDSAAPGTPIGNPILRRGPGRPRENRYVPVAERNRGGGGSRGSRGGIGRGHAGNGRVNAGNGRGNAGNGRDDAVNRRVNGGNGRGNGGNGRVNGENVRGDGGDGRVNGGNGRVNGVNGRVNGLNGRVNGGNGTGNGRSGGGGGGGNGGGGRVNAGIGGGGGKGGGVRANAGIGGVGSGGGGRVNAGVGGGGNAGPTRVNAGFGGGGNAGTTRVNAGIGVGGNGGRGTVNGGIRGWGGGGNAGIGGTNYANPTTSGTECTYFPRVFVGTQESSAFDTYC